MVPDLVRPQAKVGVWMQNPGEEEEQVGVPAVGKTGQAQDKDFLPRAALTRDDISIFNALRCRVDGSNDLPDLGKSKPA
jgi:uracil-DNA glycosylase family 4